MANMNTVVKLVSNLESTAPHQAKCDMPGSMYVEAIDPTNISNYGVLPSIKLGDIVVHYDYADDGLKPDDAHELNEWIDHMLDALNYNMELFGYKMVDEPVDGSGNGLLYGVVAYSK